MSNPIQDHAWEPWLTSCRSATHLGAAWALRQHFITLMDLEPDHRGSVPLYPTHPETGLETWTATRRAGRLQCLTRYSTGPHKEEDTIQPDLQGIGRRLINSPNLYSVISTVYALLGRSSQGGCLTPGFQCSQADFELAIFLLLGLPSAWVAGCLPCLTARLGLFRPRAHCPRGKTVPQCVCAHVHAM